MVTYYKNLVEMQEDSCRRFNEREMIGEKSQGTFVWTTYGEFAQMTDELRGGLGAEEAEAATEEEAPAEEG